MSKVRMFSFAAGAALLLCTAGSAQAVAVHIQKTLRPDTRSVGHKPHVHTAAAPVTLTQSNDPNTIQDNVSVACSAGGITTVNQWMRRFDLDGDHGISGQFCATSIDYGVELLSGGAPLHVQTHCYAAFSPGIIDLAQLTPSGDPGADFAGTDGTLYFANAVVGGCCTGSADDMIGEVTGASDCTATGSCQFFLGANSLGQTDPSYLGAADCGITNPTDLALIGFPTDHILISINGDTEGGTSGTPAMGSMGIMILVLALLGGSAIFLRRQVIG